MIIPHVQITSRMMFLKHLRSVEIEKHLSDLSRAALEFRKCAMRWERCRRRSRIPHGREQVEVEGADDVSPSAGHPEFVVHTISPEFRVIEPSIHWHRIMIRCTCEEVFSVIRRPISVT